MAQPPVEHQRASAREVFRDYGIGTLFMIGWEIYCIRDGWYNPGYEHITFSRAMAYVSVPFLFFVAVMAISAGLTLLKQRKSRPPSAGK